MFVKCENMVDIRVKEYLQTHKKIKNKVISDTMAKARGCVSVRDIANELGIDPKTAKIHLDIMEIDEFGSYLDNKKSIFCSAEGIDRLRKRIYNKK